MGKEKFDFSGYVTKANLKCSDGRIIHSAAFEDDNGKWVPLVWGHLRNSPESVLGRVKLEHRNDGMYGYAQFNETDSAKTTKELVKHGDITSMSIYANHLTQRGSNVMHGTIREVSLVYAPANPGALIDNISITHGDGYEEVLRDEAVIYTGLELDHSDIEIDIAESNGDPEGAEPPSEDDSMSHAENQNGGDKAKTVKEVYESLTDDQKALF